MKMYECYHRLLDLRGCCLHDGIFMNFGQMCGVEFCPEEICTAELVTTALHETAHFLIRYICDDFNFSSPFSFALNKTRRDPIDPDKNIESGRFIEVMLFGCQPDWAHTDRKSAMKFLLDIESESELELPL